MVPMSSVPSVARVLAVSVFGMVVVCVLLLVVSLLVPVDVTDPPVRVVVLVRVRCRSCLAVMARAHVRNVYP